MRADLPADVAWTFELLARLDRHSCWVAEHSRAVGELSRLFAIQMGLTASDQHHVHLSGLLHDVGKLCLPAALLDKVGELSKEDRLHLRAHVFEGARFLEGRAGLEAFAPTARWHHERFDGKGYPDGLAGVRIPLAARIVSTADAFQAIIGDRPFRKGRSREEAIAELCRASGTQFDPRVVAAVKCLYRVEHDVRPAEKPRWAERTA